MIRKSYSIETQPVGDRSAVFRLSDGMADLAGDVVVQSGIDLRPFRSNPVVLWNHDASTIIGTASDVRLKDDGCLYGTVNFLALGVSAKADEVCAMVKSGACKSASIGFDVVAKTPVDPSRPRGPFRFDMTKLYEVSLTALPCNVRAVCVSKTAPPPRTKEQRMRRARMVALLAGINDPTPTVAPPRRTRTKEARQRRARAIAIAAGVDPSDLPKRA